MSFLGVLEVRLDRELVGEGFGLGERCLEPRVLDSAPARRGGACQGQGASGAAGRRCTAVSWRAVYDLRGILGGWRGAGTRASAGEK